MEKIGIFQIEGWEKEIFEKGLPEVELYFTEERISKEHLPTEKDFTILSVFVGSELTADILAQFPNLKFIATRSTGYDHIDVDYCKKRGILVSNVPSYGSETVAEWTIGLMIALMRKIYQAIDQVKEQGLFDVHNLRGVELAGKTLGIIGTGRIGREVAKRAKAFNMKLLGYDLYPDEEFAKELDLQYVSLDELLANSDVVTIHCPFTPQTVHLINKENIRKFKKGSFLINTARGEIIDTEALIYGLKEKILAGAALDVLEEENFLKDELELLLHHPSADSLKKALQDHILIEMNNVLITPHNAFNSREAIERIITTTIDNIRSFLEGKPKNLI